MLRTRLSGSVATRQFSFSSLRRDSKLITENAPASESRNPGPSSSRNNFLDDTIRSLNSLDSPPNNTHSDAQSPDHSNLTSSYDINEIQQRIREWSDQTAITFRKRADEYTGTTKTAFSRLGSQLNRVTGYEEIESLKKQVVEQGT